jgi:hypothetical protein
MLSGTRGSNEGSRAQAVVSRRAHLHELIRSRSGISASTRPIEQRGSAPSASPSAKRKRRSSYGKPFAPIPSYTSLAWPCLVRVHQKKWSCRAVSANRLHLPVWGSKLPTNWLPRPPRRKSRPKSSAASSLAKSSAPGHHHTDNERDGERLERCLPNQLG